MSEEIYFASPDAFRAWLEEHHERQTEVWVGFWKKATGKQGMTWSQSVDEALCFGWIDSVAKSVDHERHRQRFTPRKATSNWSAINIAKVATLRGEGRMRPAGEAAYARRSEERSRIYSFEQRKEPQLEPEQQAQLEANEAAWAFFSAKPPSYRRPAIWWVISAKRPETRARRLATLIADSAAGQTLKHLTPSPKRKD
ncbi:MAG TPA: YdeI/OmpD-associated family protein [Solirubrobacteraceae bacterium]|nr:YdeI/OmpD-associated family protein [Solirubrobacteraceae bacterium]